jgi:hypothetical protein
MAHSLQRRPTVLSRDIIIYHTHPSRKKFSAVELCDVALWERLVSSIV